MLFASTECTDRVKSLLESERKWSGQARELRFNLSALSSKHPASPGRPRLLEQTQYQGRDACTLRTHGDVTLLLHHALRHAPRPSASFTVFQCAEQAVAVQSQYEKLQKDYNQVAEGTAHHFTCGPLYSAKSAARYCLGRAAMGRLHKWKFSLHAVHTAKGCVYL